MVFTRKFNFAAKSKRKGPTEKRDYFQIIISA